MAEPATHEIIRKDTSNWRVTPNLTEYGRLCETFSWDVVRSRLSSLPGGHGLNIAYEAVDRHAKSARADHVALRWLDKTGNAHDYTFAELKSHSDRVANLLRDLGLGKGDRVFSLLGRVPELYLTVLGTWKCGGVFCPLFSAFGPEPIYQRLSRGDGKVLITTERLFERRVAQIRERLPNLEHVILIDASHPHDERVHDFGSLFKRASETFTIEPTAADDMALIHFTSGTTGMPKGAIHVHESVIAHYATGTYALDLHPEDIFWCTADPGWVTGMSYGLIAPLVHGVTNIVDEAEYDAERWYRTLQDQRVTVWYTAPTAIRMLMRAGPDLPRQFDLSSLRFIASVGEPLNPEAVIWGRDVLGLPIHDNWWQTETGGIMIANFPATDIYPGSMGLPLPGITAAVVEQVAPDIVRVVERGEQGELALRPGWPSMFRGYLHEDERYQRCFVDGWYLTGDLARQDDSGYFWFIGRADDMIKSAGHFIGPFEVESVLIEHDAVAEAAVIGKPDPTSGEIVKAFVSLNSGYSDSPEMVRELLGFARKRLGPAVAPREIQIVESLPRTRSGKIMRRLLKARELGLPEGDTSTMEQVQS